MSVCHASTLTLLLTFQCLYRVNVKLSSVGLLISYLVFIFYNSFTTSLYVCVHVFGGRDFGKMGHVKQLNQVED